jgi:small neutral amino acid transporter SnatA (MarC family)
MSPLSAPVLAGAAVISSPALWDAFVEGSTPLTVALVRFLVSLLVCWVALEAVGMLVGPAPRKEPSDNADAAPEPDPVP